MTLVTLRCPRGASEGLISHGAQDYPPYRADIHDRDAGWLVDMPDHVAEHFLLGNSGFSRMTEVAPSPPGPFETVRVKHPDGASCGWGGVSYEPDADGVVEVPAAAVSDLICHGFRPVPEDIPTISFPAVEGAIAYAVDGQVIKAPAESEDVRKPAKGKTA